MYQFIAILNYGLIAWEAAEINPRSLIVYGFVAYILFMYLAMGALAIQLSAWAWKSAIGMFALHFALPLVILFNPPKATTNLFAGLVYWFALGGLGLWATLHPSTKKAISPPRPAT
ncbi:MAG: hypothetical protein KGI91_16385 [Burkholderiales bacterium]|nr:hypothetical protein [Burkholderiales bacterium]